MGKLQCGGVANDVLIQLTEGGVWLERAVPRLQKKKKNYGPLGKKKNWLVVVLGAFERICEGCGGVVFFWVGTATDLFGGQGLWSRVSTKKKKRQQRDRDS